MSFLDYLKINSALTWKQTDFQNDVLILEQGDLSNDERFDSGTGVNQANKSFLSASSLGIGEKRQFDLFNLTRQMFGGNISTNFSGDFVKVLYVENLNTGIGQDLYLCATGTGGFTQLMGMSYLGQTIKPSSYAIFYDMIEGFPISTGERYLYLQDINNLSGINYELAIFGVSLD